MAVSTQNAEEDFNECIFWEEEKNCCKVKGLLGLYFVAVLTGFWDFLEKMTGMNGVQKFVTISSFTRAHPTK